MDIIEQENKRIEELNKAEKYKEALKAIRNSLDINCRRPPGMGSNTLRAIAEISKITDEVLED